jgi:prevent-host-death family protein
MTTAAASQVFPKLVEKVSKQESRIVVEENGTPVAAIISAPDFERFNRAEARHLEWRKVLSRMREPFKDIPEDQLQRDVTAVVEEVRQGQRHQR